MDCQRVGALILKLRKEKGMTQKQLADRMRITDKTVSKWECGLGCPDVNLLRELSAILGVQIAHLLEGSLSEQETNGGNMKKIHFYRCPCCGTIMTATGTADISCCGRTCEALSPQPAQEMHKLEVEAIEDDFYITCPHEMAKEHFLCFVAYVTYDRMMMVRLYPEQDGAVRFPRLYGGTLYFACSKHGLFVQDGILTKQEA